MFWFCFQTHATAKAHIGSNASYAVALRELRLPVKHLNVKNWYVRVQAGLRNRHTQSYHTVDGACETVLSGFMGPCKAGHC